MRGTTPFRVGETLQLPHRISCSLKVKTYLFITQNGICIILESIIAFNGNFDHFSPILTYYTLALLPLFLEFCENKREIGRGRLGELKGEGNYFPCHIILHVCFHAHVHAHFGAGIFIKS